MRRQSLLTLLGFLASIGCRSVPLDVDPDANSRRIDWDSATLTYVCPGGYARIIRLAPEHLLMSVEERGRSVVRHSVDDGKTWSEPTLVARFKHGTASNPELLRRRDGSIWLLYNERPRDGSDQPFTIRLSISHDDGQTWNPRAKPLYVAGTRGSEGCWEPSAIELPWGEEGEVLVFFANEAPYRDSNEQEITMLRTRDGDEIFDAPTRLAFRPQARDGMPVPTKLRDGSIAIAIEDSGLTPDGQMKPVIIRLPKLFSDDDADIGPNDANRWPAVERDWPRDVYVGAPYLVTMPDGTTILSSQSTEFGHEQRMVVYVGNADAKQFTSVSQPFPVDAGKSGRWNSLFVKDDQTVTALSGTTIGGKSGIWTIDGHVTK